MRRRLFLAWIDSNARTRSVMYFCCCNGRVTRVTIWKAAGSGCVVGGELSSAHPSPKLLLLTAERNAFSPGDHGGKGGPGTVVSGYTVKKSEEA
jgi:hypothetical protein